MKHRSDGKAQEGAAGGSDDGAWPVAVERGGARSARPKAKHGRRPVPASDVATVGRSLPRWAFPSAVV